MQITISDIAKEAGVSGTTVSLAFQVGSRISDETREKVLAVANRLSYVPNLAARNLRQQKTSTIGVVVPDITDAFFGLLVREFERVVQARGFQVLIAECQWQGDRERSIIESMIEARVQGVLLCSCESGEDNVTLLQQYEIPVIMADTYPDGYEGDFVATDFTAIGEEAGEHLYKADCHKPLLITASKERSSYSSLARLQEGFCSFWQEQDCGVLIENFGLDCDDGRRAMLHALKTFDSFDCCFCVNDDLALGALDVLQSYPDRQPIAVLGVNDNRFAKLEMISLSSFTLPCIDMADIATNALLDKIEGKKCTIHKHLNGELIVRESTNKNNLI